MKDAIGKVIRLGDTVVKSYYGGYAQITLAIVIGFTEKMVRLDPLKGGPTFLSEPQGVLVVNEVIWNANKENLWYKYSKEKASKLIALDPEPESFEGMLLLALVTAIEIYEKEHHDFVY